MQNEAERPKRKNIGAKLEHAWKELTKIKQRRNSGWKLRAAEAKYGRLVRKAKRKKAARTVNEPMKAGTPTGRSFKGGAGRGNA